MGFKLYLDFQLELNRSSTLTTVFLNPRCGWVVCIEEYLNIDSSELSQPSPYNNWLASLFTNLWFLDFLKVEIEA